MRRLLRCLQFTTLGLLSLLGAKAEGQSEGPWNILLITADDLGCDSVGAFGGRVVGATPSIDRLAESGMRFERAHVAVAVCQPSRQCLMTGTFPQANGSVGFYPLKAAAVTLPQMLQSEGYLLGILGKVDHLQPTAKFPWDFERSGAQLGAGRDPERYYAQTRAFLARAKGEGRPFFLMANSHDPHRPFSGAEGELRQLARWERKGAREDDSGALPVFPAPSRVFSPDEIAVPGFLPDLPEIRKELAQYYSSVRRCDDTVGRILQALDDEGLRERTIIVFLSDNGIAVPFAKSNCYLASTRTPLIVSWPGRVKAGSVERDHFVSAVDLLPTVLDALGKPVPAGLHGSSFLPLLQGQRQVGRELVFTVYNETSAKIRYEMRAVQDRRFGYVFNAWSDGRKAYRAESMEGLTFRAMQAAAKEDPAIAQRVELWLHRVPEELYDLSADPDCTVNLVGDSRYADDLQRLRANLARWLAETGDTLAARVPGVTAKRE